MTNRPLEFCARCGHPADWHRHDDADSHAATDPDCPFRCLGYDCEKPGFPAGTPETHCGCPNYVKPEPVPTTSDLMLGRTNR